MKPKTKFNIIAILIIMAWTAIIYSNTFGNAFHFDDEMVIVNNSSIKDISSTLNNFDSRRFLLHLSLALNYYFNGLEVFGYHLVNLIIHISVCVLVYFIIDILTCKIYFNKECKSDGNEFRLLPLFSALLFATHPINSQTVNYISARSSSLCIFFYLLSFFLFIKYLNQCSRQSLSGNAGRHTIYYFGSLVIFLMASSAREMAITLPIILIAYDYLFSDPKPSLTPFEQKNSNSQTTNFSNILYKSGVVIRKYKLYQLPYWGIIILGLIKMGIPSIIVPLHTNLLMACKAYVYYLKLLFLPTGLSIDHYFIIPDSFFQSFNIIPICIVILLIVIGITLYRKARLISFCILLYFIALVPTSSVILRNPGSLTTMIAEHRIYASAIGFCVLLAILIIYIANILKEKILLKYNGLHIVNNLFLISNRKSYIVQYILVVPLLLSLSVLTIQRNSDWKDELSIWQSAVKYNPDSFKSQYNLGLAYTRKKAWAKSITHYSKALEINYGDPQTHNNIGTSYKEEGNLGKAIDEFKIAIRIKQDYTDAHFNLAVAYNEKSGFRDDAIKEYNISLTLKPDNVIAMYNLGNILMESKNYDDAMPLFEKAIHTLDTKKFGTPEMIYAQYSPINDLILQSKETLRVKSLSNLGSLYFRKGQIDKAVDKFKDALKLSYNDGGIHNKLGHAYYKKGNTEKAVAEFKTAIMLNPKLEEAHNSLGIIYSSQELNEDAFREFTIAVQLKPEYANAQKNLGIMYLNYKNDIKNASIHLKESIKLDPNQKRAEEIKKLVEKLIE